MKRTDEMLENMIAHFGVENIPNPLHYPIRFEFLVRSYEHYLRMKGTTNENIQ